MDTPTPVTGETALAARTSLDRGLGAAVHVSSIFWPLLGPLVGWIVFRKRPFVAAHARQALMETIVLNVSLFVVGLASLVYTIVRIVHFVQTDWADFNIVEFILRFLVGWVLLALLETVNTVYSVVQAWKAGHGEWPRKRRPATAG